MVFGWAPSVELASPRLEGDSDFFSRLEADYRRTLGPCMFTYPYLVNRRRAFTSSAAKQLKRKRKSVPTTQDILRKELEAVANTPPQLSSKENMFMLGDLNLILAVREEIHTKIQLTRAANISNTYKRVSSGFNPFLVSPAKVYFAK